MPQPSFDSDRIDRIPPPEERYYLFWLGLPAYDRYERLDIAPIPHRAIMNADFAFVRSSDEEVPYVEFRVYKNRSGIPFNYTPEFAWLKRQFPSMEYFHSLTPQKREGIIRVTDARDLILIKVLHGPDKCENRGRHS